MDKRLMQLLAGAVGLLAVSCSDAVDGPTGVHVVGSDTVDFGRLHAGQSNARASFQLRNGTSRKLTIATVRQSCTCMSYDLESHVMAPGGETTLTVELETSMVAGQRNGQALVVFDDDEVEPLTVRFEAFVEMPYTVRVMPASWAIPSTAAPGETIERTFTVTEFSARETETTIETLIASENDDVRVVRTEPWEVRGWRTPGFARRAFVTLAYRVPESPFVGDLKRELRLTRNDSKAHTAGVTVLIQTL